MLSIFASVWLVLCLPAAYGLGMLQPFASLARWPSTADMMDYATTRLGRKHQRCSPENVHIALHSDPTEMTVMWMTDHSRCPTFVQFWRVVSFSNRIERRQLGSQRTQDGTSDSLTAKDMCGEPARSNGYEKTWQHSVVLTSLQPGEEYGYTVGNDPTTYSFTAAPPVGSGAKMSFVMYGDMGVSTYRSAKAPGCGFWRLTPPNNPTSGTYMCFHPAFASKEASMVMDAVRKEVKEQNTSIVFHVGDVSYGDGLGKVWYAFMEEISTFAASTPYMVGVGNHDYDYKAGKESRDPSNANPFRPKGKFRDAAEATPKVPAPQSERDTPDCSWKHAPENPPFWYSFEHGLIHFVMLSSEHSMKRHSKQWEWLVAHLKSIDRCKTPWLIVGFHRPLYAIHPHRANRVIAKYLRHQLEDVLVKYGVDVVASGHVHAYSRSCPVIGKHCVPFKQGSVLHVITGSAGRKLSKVKNHQPHWVASAQYAWGFSRFTVEESGEGESEMLVEFVNAEDGAVTDSITLRNTLRRDRHCSYCYSRSNGAVLRSPEVSSAVAAQDVRGECGVGHGSADLDVLAQERLAAEHPKWAEVLENELPADWMRWAAEELDPDVAAGMAQYWSNSSVHGAHLDTAPSIPSGMHRVHGPLENLFSLQDPDDDMYASQ